MGGKIIVESLMRRFGWTDIWRGSSNYYYDRYFVGVWTGEQHDLICIKECKSNTEAEKYLSPEGFTILLATIGAILKHFKLKRREDGKMES